MRRRLSSLSLVVIAAALVFAAGSLLPGTADAAARPCVAKIIADWDDNKPRLKGRYPVTCYREAIREAPQDIKIYTDFIEDVERARTREIRRLGIKDPGDSTDVTDTEPPTGTDTTGTGTDTGPDPTGPTPTDEPPDTSDPTSVPVPLIVLGALSGVLLALGGAGYLRRRGREDSWGQDLDEPDSPAGGSGTESSGSDDPSS
ncbi:MAG: hypothetical protein ACKVUT_01020 [Gaiella sp.]